MTEGTQNYNINDILKPIDIDFDKLFSLSYTFDNLKSFMKNMLKNQQIMADKINELEKNSSQQKEENKKALQFQINMDRRLKTIEITNAKNKKEMHNLKIKHDEEQNKEKEKVSIDNKDDKDVTDADNDYKDLKREKKEIKESNVEKKNIEYSKHVSDRKLSRYSQMDKENDFSGDEEEYMQNDLFVSNQEIQELKDKIESIEKDLNKIKAEKNISTK